MATVTGTLLDANLVNLASRQPRIFFTLSGPATLGGGYISDGRVEVTFDTASGWSVSLAATDSMDQIRYYEMSVEYLNESGGFTRVEYPEWKIYVPTAGGTLPNLLINYLANPMMVFFQSTEPSTWNVGSVWVNSATGDINRKVA